MTAGVKQIAAETDTVFKQFNNELGQNLNGINESVLGVSSTITTSNEGLKESLASAGETMATGVKQIASETDGVFKQFNNELGQNLNGINETILATSSSIGAGNEDLMKSFASAGDSIESNAKQISDAISTQNSKLARSLSGLSDTVVQTNDDVHNMAAKRLNTQEADLSKKLNAAAAMFQSLANPSQAAAIENLNETGVFRKKCA